MASRRAVEDELLAALRAALPAGVEADSLPARELADEIARLRKAAVFLVYVGADAGAPSDMALFRQAETWRWAAVILAREYRSAQARGAAGLDLLEAVVDALSGVETTAGRFYKLSESIMDLDDGFTGVLAYQVLFAVDAAFRRHA